MRRLSVFGVGPAGQTLCACLEARKRTVMLAPLKLVVGPLSERPNYQLLPPRPAADSTSAPGHRERHTLVLDLDETLVSSCLQREYSFTAIRPHTVPFLREMNELFELVFWTAGTESYGRAVLGAIEACGHKLDGRPVVGDNYPHSLFRHHTLEELNFMKYLGHLNRDATNCLLIDDNQRSFPLTPRQGITCKRFEFTRQIDIKQELGAMVARNGAIKYDKLKLPPGVASSPHDDELVQLTPLLRAVAVAGNVADELDHWRPDGYERCDDIMQDYYESGVGDWTASRRTNGPIPPLGDKFRASWALLHPTLQTVLGKPAIRERQ